MLISGSAVVIAFAQLDTLVLPIPTMDTQSFLIHIILLSTIALHGQKQYNVDCTTCALYYNVHAVVSLTCPVWTLVIINAYILPNEPAILNYSVTERLGGSALCHIKQQQVIASPVRWKNHRQLLCPY